jgi:hypothetical protein
MKYCSRLCVKPWRMKILKVSFQEKNLYTLRDCDKACESTIFTKSRNKVWIQVGQGTKRKVCTRGIK